MKKILISGVIAIAIILNLSSILTAGLKAYDTVFTSLGVCTVEEVDYMSELIYMLEEKGL